MQALLGASALSAFKLQKLQDSVCASVPLVTSLSAQFVHFVDNKVALSAEQELVLAGLLEYGETYSQEHSGSL